MTDPNQRRVSVHMSLPGTPAFTMTILPGDETSLPGLDTNPVITKVAETNSDAASQVKQWMGQLISRDEEFITWLESSPENSMLFVSDPVAAVRQALPDLAQSVHDQLPVLPQLITAP